MLPNPFLVHPSTHLSEQGVLEWEAEECTNMEAVALHWREVHLQGGRREAEKQRSAKREASAADRTLSLATFSSFKMRPRRCRLSMH